MSPESITVHSIGDSTMAEKEPGEHPNYPDGVSDDTHFSEHGARRMAELVLEGIEELDLEPTARVVRDDR
nr:hypothetical protein [Natronorubrum halophilum]